MSGILAVMLCGVVAPSSDPHLHAYSVVNVGQVSGQIALSFVLLIYAGPLGHVSLLGVARLAGIEETYVARTDKAG